jgi:hypothetical protein
VVPGFWRVFSEQARNRFGRTPPGWGWLARVIRVGGEGFVDAAVPQLLVAVNAASVDLPPDLNAVAGPGGDFGCGDAGVECEGDAAAAQVVGAGGER